MYFDTKHYKYNILQPKHILQLIKIFQLIIFLFYKHFSLLTLSLRREMTTHLENDYNFFFSFISENTSPKVTTKRNRQESLTQKKKNHGSTLC